MFTIVTKSFIWDVWRDPIPPICIFTLKTLNKLKSSNRVRPLTLSWRKYLSYRNQSIYLQSNSMDWFLYDRNLHHERVNYFQKKVLSYAFEYICSKKRIVFKTELKFLKKSFGKIDKNGFTWNADVWICILR